MSEEKAEEKTPKKHDKHEKGKLKKDKLDPARFEGDGVLFKAKLIGVEDVTEARGDKMCLEAMAKLKAAVKSQGGHKPRLNIYVSLDGMKIFEEKTSKLSHHHTVHRISFISRDPSDSRAFGYVFGDGEGSHKFYAIKTEKAAENLVLTLRDLFQVVFELKRKEVEIAKKAKENNNDKEEPVYEVPSDNPRTVDDFKEDPDNGHIYEVPTSNAAVTKPEESVGTLLDLETELASISQGIAQMDAFQTDPFTFDSPPSAGTGSQDNDAWSSPPTQAKIPLVVQAGFPPLGTPSSDPFVVPRQPGASLVLPTPPPSRPVAPSGNQPANQSSTPASSAFPPPTSAANVTFGDMSTPKAKADTDPFKTDPFFSSTPAQKPAADKYSVFQDLSLNSTVAGGNMFNESAMFTSNATDNTMNNAFATSGNIFDGPSLVPQQSNTSDPVPEPEKQETKANLFDDLNPIGNTKTAKPPKEMFAEMKNPPKKSLNEIKQEQRALTPDFEVQALQTSPDPFGSAGESASAGFSTDPFLTNPDPFSMPDSGVDKSADAATNPFGVSQDPFAPPGQSVSPTGNVNSSQASSNPFEIDAFTTSDPVSMPTQSAGSPVKPQSSPFKETSPRPNTSDDFDLPSPDAPPPPLPAEATLDFADVAPAPPPRPRPKSNASQLTAKSSDVPKLTPPMPRPRKSLLKTEEATKETSSEMVGNSAKVPSPELSVKVPSPEPSANVPSPESSTKVPSPEPLAKVPSPEPSAKVCSESSERKPETVPDDPFASDPFFTSPIPPCIPKPDQNETEDDPFAKFDAKFPSDCFASSTNDSSDPFSTPFDFSSKGQEPLYATVNKSRTQKLVDLL